MLKGKDTKPHIGIFGRRNNGKSSLINALTDQDIAIVAEVPGTTADPVKKSTEIEGIGPVVLIDTAGIDDSGILGEKRVEKTLQTLKNIDAAILVIAENKFDEPEEKLINEFLTFEIPFLIIHNKSDLQASKASLKQKIYDKYEHHILDYSTFSPDNRQVAAALKKIVPETIYQQRSLLESIIKTGDIVLLITPVDTEAPEGRLILPQVQVIRDTLNNNCISVIAKETEVADLIKKLHPRPALAITDSQVFPKANTMVPEDIPLTSFSIVLAHSKGDFASYLKGTPKISELKDGDKVLIMESCTHHITCDDIGRSKIPFWLTKYSGKKLTYDIISGTDLPPRNAEAYNLVIQCGGCMFTRKQLLNRLKPYTDKNIPVTNYGMAIAWIHGIYKRAIAPFIQKEQYD